MPNFHRVRRDLDTVKDRSLPPLSEAYTNREDPLLIGPKILWVGAPSVPLIRKCECSPFFRRRVVDDECASYLRAKVVHKLEGCGHKETYSAESVQTKSREVVLVNEMNQTSELPVFAGHHQHDGTKRTHTYHTDDLNGPSLSSGIDPAGCGAHRAATADNAQKRRPPWPRTPGRLARASDKSGEDYRMSQVGCHDCRRAAEEHKGRGNHSSIPERNQLWEPSLVGCFQDVDWV